MQGFLEEYQHALTALEIEKADKQQEIVKLDKLLKGKAQTEERYKDEIWNLELNKQELLQKVHDLSQNLSRSTTEQNRLASEEAKLCQEVEHYKMIQHTWETDLALAQEQHEQETIALKKTLLTLRLEKDQISRQLQQVLAIQQDVIQQQNALRHVNCSTPNNENDPAITALAPAVNAPHQSTIPHSKSLAARHEAEVRALKTSLDQAHDIIQTMQAKIEGEREERIEIDKLLREAQETIEQMNSHHYSPSTPQLRQYSPIANTLLSPSSPASGSSRRLRRSLRSPREPSQSRKRLAIATSSPYHPQRDKSLGDELSLAGSTGNLMPSSPGTSVHNESGRRCQQALSTASLHLYQAAPERTVALTCVELPSISNHDLFSSFTSTSTTSDSSNHEQVQLQKIASNNELYGSLIREPRSYIYRSARDKRTADKQKQKSPSFKLNFDDDDFNIDAAFSRQDGEGDDDDGESAANAVTRTMIGDWMWKYTRKVVGSGISENRHCRFFWIHPYTQTLYWSSREPGIYSSECTTKSGIRNFT
ncbi:meiotic cell cortex C-terminal pleckstrin homology-domain-containing protein [Parasitella parasitica]|nr:meiotic cell cortex C-terminal pleckstrin homology-domain-containing protein [Parasitella parasitica]